jgi:lysophospholipase L1-like esterase
MKKTKNHIVLLGDSIFDNSPYVGPDELDVPNQLRALVKGDCKVTHLAVDGDVISDIRNQLRRLPSDATHLFVSVGGNDGLGHLSIFNEPVDTIGNALQKIYLLGESFQKKYSEMVDLVLSHNLPTTLCSIYYPKFHSRSLSRVEYYLSMKANGETIQQMAMAAETIFNDIITFEIFKRKLPLIDLRVICNDDKDFANPIEPSCIGGLKIASAIKKVVSVHEFSKNVSVVYC